MMPSRRAVLTGAAGALALGTGGVALYARRAGEQYGDYAKGLRAPLDSNSMAGFIRCACLAANGHNTQPWLFAINGNRLDILPDFSRRTPIVDPDDHHLYVSLGCALENALLAIESRGLSGSVQLLDNGRGGVSVEISDTDAVLDPMERALFGAIPLRQSTRAVYSGATVGSEQTSTLGRASRMNDLSISLLTERKRIAAIRDLVVEGNKLQMADPAFMRELLSWLRFSPSQAMETGDGLYSATSGNPPMPEWLGPLAFRLTFKSSSETDKYARQMESSAGVAVFAADRADPAGWLAVGRSCQRFCLAATALGLKTAFVNQPVEVGQLRPALADAAGLSGLRPDIILRFGYADPLPFSARRPVSQVVKA